jgi:MFS family permease
MVFSTLLRIPGGYIADKHGRSKIIGLAVITSGFGYLFFIFANSWVWLLPGIILLSLTSLSEPATEAIKADSVDPENRGRGYALINTIPDIPALISPAIGGYLIVENSSKFGISLNGIRAVYSYLLAGVILAGLIRLFFIKDIHQNLDSEMVKRTNRLVMMSDIFSIVKESQASLRKLLLLGGFFMFCFHLDSSMRAVYAINVAKLSTIQWGWIITITSVVSLLSALIIGGFVDRYGRKEVFIPSVIILGFSTLLFMLSETYLLFLISRIIGGIGLYGRMISFQVLVADSVPSNTRGRIMALYNIFSSLGSSSAILVSGILFDISPNLPFIVSFTAYGLATIVALKFLKEPEIKHY